MKKYYIFLLLCTLSVHSAIAQDANKKYEMNGYLSSMQSTMFQKFDEYWISDNILQNRLNLAYFPTENFKTVLQLRTRFLWGESFKFNPEYVNGIDDDNGIIKLSHNVVKEPSTILNMSADRFWLQYTSGNLEITAGRQRINWGRAFVWNPNDLFNNYSFFDFDYPEKPGTDAILMQYYTGAESSIEMVVSANKREEITAAALVKFNRYNYDFQILAGLLEQKDVNLGVGWSGDAIGMGFRGEASYFHPYKNSSDTSGLFMLSISIDKLFPNELHLMAEMLYANIEKPSANSFTEFYNRPQNVKSIALVPLQFFAQGSYPITPIWQASASIMYYPEMEGFFTGPGINYSIADNWEASISGQYFSGKFPDVSGNKTQQQFTYAFLRIKGSF